MALQNKAKSINLTANSVVDGAIVAQFTANIENNSPQAMAPVRTIFDSIAYRANRSEVMQDQSDFEVEAYALLDSMTPKESTDETI